MALSDTSRFPIRFDAAYRILSTALVLPASWSYVEIRGDEVCVRMGWAFWARFPRAAVASVAEYGKRPISRGVHGLLGRWLVNGSGRGLVVIDLEPRQRAFVTGLPVRLRQLVVSMEDPAGLMKALAR